MRGKIGRIMDVGIKNLFKNTEDPRVNRTSSILVETTTEGRNGTKGLV